MTKTIKIDIEVHRAIESRRQSFAQSENDILREVFGIPTEPPQPPSPPKRPRRRHHRGITGRYAFVLLGERVEEDSLEGSVHELSATARGARATDLRAALREAYKGRRIVARRPEDLYLKTPELAEKFAVQLTDQWWVDTNLSRLQCEKRFKTAAAHRSDSEAIWSSIFLTLCFDAAVLSQYVNSVSRASTWPMHPRAPWICRRTSALPPRDSSPTMPSSHRAVIAASGTAGPPEGEGFLAMPSMVQTGRSRRRMLRRSPTRIAKHRTGAR